MEERIKKVEEIFAYCEYYLSFVNSFGNECAATDSAIRTIKELAADIKEFDISEGGI